MLNDDAGVRVRGRAVVAGQRYPAGCRRIKNRSLGRRKINTGVDDGPVRRASVTGKIEVAKLRDAAEGLREDETPLGERPDTLLTRTYVNRLFLRRLFRIVARLPGLGGAVEYICRLSFRLRVWFEFDG